MAEKKPTANPAVDAHSKDTDTKKPAAKPKDDTSKQPEMEHPARPNAGSDADVPETEPVGYDARGDAYPLTEPAPGNPFGLDGEGHPVQRDPLLDESAQQPGESAEHYAARSGKPMPQPGVYDASLTRSGTPQGEDVEVKK